MDFGSIKTFEFTYNNKKYVLQEASEDAVRKYRNGIMKKARLGSDGKPASYDDIADLDSELLSPCLFEEKPDGNRSPVTVVMLRSNWPHRVVKQLVEKVQEMSEMSQPETVGDIDKQISNLSKKKEELLSQQAEDSAKNEQ